jgi:hypothetical protein
MRIRTPRISKSECRRCSRTFLQKRKGNVEYRGQRIKHSCGHRDECASALLGAGPLRFFRLPSTLNTEKPTASDEAKFAESHLKQEDRIRTAISEEKCRIAEMVDRDIAVAVDRAGHELNAYAAELAVTLAGARIQVDISTDKALVHNFIDHWDKMATIARLPSKADRLSLFILDRH